MALVLLPAEIIPDGFKLLRHKVLISNHTRQLESFVSYFEKEWLNTFTPSMWSVNRSTYRTNNFAEGRERLYYDYKLYINKLLMPHFVCLAQNKRLLHVLFKTIQIFGDLSNA